MTERTPLNYGSDDPLHRQVVAFLRRVIDSDTDTDTDTDNKQRHD